MDSDVEMCSSPWTRIGDLTGCYQVGADKASWDVAEDACQNLHAQAHLVSFETDEVSICEYVTKNILNVFLQHSTLTYVTVKYDEKEIKFLIPLGTASCVSTCFLTTKCWICVLDWRKGS